MSELGALGLVLHSWGPLVNAVFLSMEREFGALSLALLYWDERDCGLSRLGARQTTSVTSGLGELTHALSQHLQFWRNGKRRHPNWRQRSQERRSLTPTQPLPQQLWSVSVTRIVKKRTLGLQDLELPFPWEQVYCFPLFLLLALTGCACCLEALRKARFPAFPGVWSCLPCLPWSMSAPRVETSVAPLSESPSSASLRRPLPSRHFYAFPLLYAPWRH